VDLHADTPVLMRLGMDMNRRHRAPLPGGAWGFHLDLPRMEAGGLAAQAFGLVSLPGRGAGQTVDRLLDALERAEQRSGSKLVSARTGTDIRAARASGQIASLRGIEGAHALNGDLDRVAHFAARGVTYLGLLHFTANEAGAPAYGRGRDDAQGLSSFGHALVDELERLGVLPDLAHVNRRGFLEAAGRAQGPVIVSHTGVSGVSPHWRNIDDDQIRAVARTGGCIGVIFGRRYLGGPGLDAACSHLEHIIRVGGEDTPALGSDFDGLVTPPRGLRDVSRLPALTAALLSRGRPRRQVAKILGDNILRVLG
jgi:membrane dipeptidase